jgi:hypothetical protein
MKKLAIMMFTLAASLAAQDLSGIWNGKGGKEDPKYGTVPQTAQMTVLQAGTSFHGTLKLGAGGAIMPITNGTSSGGKMTFTIVTGKSQITGNLGLSGSQLSGKMTASNGSTFDFVFTKQ